MRALVLLPSLTVAIVVSSCVKENDPTPVAVAQEPTHAGQPLIQTAGTADGNVFEPIESTPKSIDYAFELAFKDVPEGVLRNDPIVAEYRQTLETAKSLYVMNSDRQIAEAAEFILQAKSYRPDLTRLKGLDLLIDHYVPPSTISSSTTVVSGQELTQSGNMQAGIKRSTTGANQWDEVGYYAPDDVRSYSTGVAGGLEISQSGNVKTRAKNVAGSTVQKHEISTTKVSVMQAAKEVVAEIQAEYYRSYQEAELLRQQQRAQIQTNIQANRLRAQEQARLDRERKAAEQAEHAAQAEYLESVKHRNIPNIAGNAWRQ
ncbi:MAG: hypothetical protein HY706_11565 [Candidatus Hydrogenedentes bacterium]|nr:hypothetical protein [Candidatus Hydrogenedentota bacterium]